MSRRSKVLIGITAVVLIVMVVVLYLLWKGKRGEPTQPAEVIVSSQGAASTPGGETVPLSTITYTPFATAEATARSFAERWGSFSTESDYQNVQDLYSVMTPTMRTWADKYVSDQRAKPASSEFFGVTTRAMKAEIIENKNNAVRIQVTTQRIETKSNAPSKSYYQTMELSLVKNGDGYLVDGAWWR
jgi:hypothetical protein